MRMNRIVLVVILATLAIYSACRKLDMTSNGAKTESIKQKEERFFNASTAIPLQIQVLSEYMKRENFRLGFVNKTVNQIGYPRWDKSLIYSGKRQGPGGRGSTGDSVSLVYIPFVRDSQQYVNASLIIKTTPTDTVYKYLCDWQYKDLGFDTTGTNWNAFDAFLVFATLDKNVFNRNRFVIKDSNLLNPVVSSLLSSAGKKFDSTKIVYTLQPIQGAGRGSDYWDINTICYQIGACIESTTIRGATVGSCPSNSFWVEWTECYDTWVWIETGGGSGGSGNGNGNGGSGTGGGGSGSGSGGGTPPECDPIAVKGMNVVPGCDPGWEPEPDDPPNPNSEPIDSMLARYSRKIKARVDSLLAKSLNYNWEHSMIIVKLGDSIYLKNEKTIQDSVSTGVDFTLAPGEILLGYIHCHSSSSLNIFDRSAPSGSDVKFLSEKLVLNFVQMTECGNSGYAMVIEDVAKANIFLNSLTRYDLDERLRDSALVVPGWFQNWQNATKVALMNLLGSSSDHGIGFYKSSDPMRENWIKLN